MQRREFMKAAGAGAAALALPWDGLARRTEIRQGRLLGPEEKLRIACVGCGGKGQSDIGGVAGEQIVALCDVDAARAGGVFGRYPDVPKYKDFRQMLAEQDERIDAVTVSTPDHMHFPAAMMAIEMGKHVYVQKPLTHTIDEARRLTLAARKHRVVTQMGNQGHANEGTRLLKEWVEADAIGKVHEVHCWTNRPIWPQGLERPSQADPVPDTLDWNRWLGVAPERPFHKGYLPFNWRGWWDFGCGALGDMGCHLVDAAFWALDLKYPSSVEAECSPVNRETAPNWSVVTYRFPARGSLPPVKFVWYDGGKMPPRPEGLEPEREMKAGGGFYLVGEKGCIMDTSSYCKSPRLVPEDKMKAFLPNRPPASIPRVPGGDPHKEWVAACKGGPAAGSNFDHAGPLTEMILLGNLAIRTGKKIEWDGKAMVCRKAPEANEFVRKPYRLY